MWLWLALAFYAGAGFASAIICFAANTWLGKEDDRSYLDMAIQLVLLALLWPILVYECITEMDQRDPDYLRKKEDERKD